MNRLKSWLKAIVLTWLLLLSLVTHAADVPMLKRHITDQTNTLTSEQIEQLDKKLLALEQNKGAQLVVLMVPTTTPQDIESYALAVFEANEIGRKDTNDGILLLIAKDDRRNRIEVGYGLEGAVPDAIAAQILRESLAPHFKQGDFFSGIDVGVDQLIKLINGETLPPPAPTDSNYTNFIRVAFLITGLILFGIYNSFLIRGVVFSILGKEKIKSLIVRMCWGAGTLFILCFICMITTIFNDFTSAFYTILIGTIIGTLVFAIPPNAAKRIDAYFSGGGSGGGGSSSGGVGFGGGGGGGFSGGGGRSGGGGASGSW